MTTHNDGKALPEWVIPPIRDLIDRTPHDWPTEDQENGSYLIKCRCGVTCLGPKRAYQCYTCYQTRLAELAAMTPEQRATEEERLIKIVQQTLGEYVGFCEEKSK
jgi:hypothetical protein